MSVVGQQRTSSAIAIYVRYWGLSGHPMSAFGPARRWHGPLGSTSSPISERPLQAPWRLTQRDLGLAAPWGLGS